MFCFIFSLSFFFCSFFEVFWEGRWREEKGRELKCWQKKTQLLPLKERKREIGRREDRWRRRQKKKKNQKEMEQKKKKHVLLEASTTMSIGWSCSTEGRLMENKEQQGKKKNNHSFYPPPPPIHQKNGIIGRPVENWNADWGAFRRRVTISFWTFGG